MAGRIIQTAGHSYMVSASLSSHESTEGAVEYLRQRKAELDTQGTVAASPEGEDSPLDRLERLADLRDRGAISEEEFNDKKQELMAEI